MNLLLSVSFFRRKAGKKKWLFTKNKGGYAVILLVCSVIRLPAQSIWDGSSLVHNPRSKVVHIESPEGKVEEITLPPRSLTRDFMAGKLYAHSARSVIDQETGRRKSFVNELWRWEVDSWQLDAAIESPAVPFNYFNITPLKNGKYMVLSLLPITEDEKGVYLLGIYKKDNKGQLALERVLQFPVPKGEERYFDGAICRTDSKIVMQSSSLGWMYVFDAEDGRFLRKKSIYPEISEDALRAGKKFISVNLALQPTWDGRIICTTFSKNFVFSGPPPKNSGSIPFTGDPPPIEELRKMSDTLTDMKWSEPIEMYWWEFQPDSGHLERMPTPDGFPEKMDGGYREWAGRFDREKQDGGYYRYTWQINVDGTLSMLDRNRRPIEAANIPTIIGTYEKFP